MALALVVAGCKKDKPNNLKKPSKATVQAPANKVKALDKQLKELGAQQKERSAELARLAKNPKVKANPKVLSAAKALAQQQAEVAMLTSRTAAAVATTRG